jgi:hypothetical protein
MDQQPDPNDPQGFCKKEYKIRSHGPIRMQGMKINAASIWIENWGGQQMINVYEDGCQHN